MSAQQSSKIRLSICIATFNRGSLIKQTLDSCRNQLSSSVELLVVDGHSEDATPQVMASYCRDYPEVRYIREPLNSGVDADFDKAVGYARGEFCWLMTDDDLLVDGAIARVLNEITVSDPDLLVVDTSVFNADYSQLLQHSRMFLDHNLDLQGSSDEFMKIAGNQLSFIGSVIIRRSSWLQRDREKYYGSLFIHVGVIMQTPGLNRIRVLAKPVLRIRYGNAMWTARAFEIWMFMWPQLIWSFDLFSDSAKRKVCARHPWRNPMELLKHRAKGSYSTAEYRRFIQPRAKALNRLAASAIARMPATLANFLAVAYVIGFKRQARMGLRDLLDSPHAGHASILISRIFPLAKINQ